LAAVKNLNNLHRIITNAVENQIVWKVGDHKEPDVGRVIVRKCPARTEFRVGISAAQGALSL